MSNFEYVKESEYLKSKEDIDQLIKLVQEKIKEEFTFNYEFVGSFARKMITRDVSSNVGYDFDINLEVNVDEKKYQPSKIKNILMNAFNFNVNEFNFDCCEDDTRVFTIKVKDEEKSKILYSCDFAIIKKHNSGKQQYIRHNKNKDIYLWQPQRKGFYHLQEKIDQIKKENLWPEVKTRYLDKKNKNTDNNKKSCSLFAETINDIYMKLQSKTNKQ